MSIIVRVVVIVTCAYAGSIVAGAQFADLRSAEMVEMKQSAFRIEEQKPRNIPRTDIAPADGFALVVDGHFKTQFESNAPAQKAAKELLANYPMLRVEIYDASTKGRTLIRQ